MGMRTQAYDTLLRSVWARRALATTTGAGMFYAGWDFMPDVIPNLVMPAIIPFKHFLVTTGTALLAGTTSYYALARAATGKVVNIVEARIYATMTGLFTGALSWAMLDGLMPHIPVVSNFVNTGSFFAALPAFMIGVEAGHAYLNAVRRRDLHPVEKKPGEKESPEAYKARRAEEYRKFLIERAQEKGERQEEESRYILRTLGKKLGMATALTGLFCALDPSFSVDRIPEYVTNNWQFIAGFFTLSTFVFSGMLEKMFDKAGRIAQKSGYLALALTGVAALNGFDLSQLAPGHLISNLKDTADSYTAALMATPMLSAILAIGYLKAPRTMNRVIFETIPRVGKYAIRYAWDRAATLKDIGDQALHRETFISLADTFGGIAKTGAVWGLAVTGGVAGFLGGLEVAQALDISRVGSEVFWKFSELSMGGFASGAYDLLTNTVYGGSAMERLGKLALTGGSALGGLLAVRKMALMISHGIENAYDRRIGADMETLVAQPVAAARAAATKPIAAPA